MKKEFTATTYIFKENKFLLLYHKKLQKWLPPGGHVDPGELPHEAAKREVKEETGLDIHFIFTERLWIEPQPNAQGIPTPYFMLEEKIPAYKDQPEHRHIDCIYLAIPADPKAPIETDEEHRIQWHTLEEILAYETGIDIFPDTQIVAKSLAKEWCRAVPFYPPYDEIKTALQPASWHFCPK